MKRILCLFSAILLMGISSACGVDDGASLSDVAKETTVNEYQPVSETTTEPPTEPEDIKLTSGSYRNYDFKGVVSIKNFMGTAANWYSGEIANKEAKEQIWNMLTALEEQSPIEKAGDKMVYMESRGGLHITLTDRRSEEAKEIEIDYGVLSGNIENSGDVKIIAIKGIDYGEKTYTCYPIISNVIDEDTLRDVLSAELVKDENLIATE